MSDVCPSRHRHTRPMILSTHADWLERVADLPEADLPCNVSTVAYAIEVAVAYRTEAAQWRAMFEELAARCPNCSLACCVEGRCCLGEGCASSQPAGVTEDDPKVDAP